MFDQIMAKNFPDLKNEIDIQVQEVQKIPNKMNLKRPTPRHITKRVMYKGILIRLSPDFSAEILQARMEWHDVFKVLERKNL